MYPEQIERTERTQDEKTVIGIRCKLCDKQLEVFVNPDFPQIQEDMLSAEATKHAATHSDD